MAELALVSIYELTAMLLDAKEGAQSNREQCAYVSDRAARIATELRQFGAGDTDEWASRHAAVFECLKETLVLAVELCKGYGKKGYLRRLAFHSCDARAFDDIVTRLDAAIVDLQLGVACDHRRWEQAQRLDSAALATMLSSLVSGQQGMQRDLRQLIVLLNSQLGLQSEPSTPETAPKERLGKAIGVDQKLPRSREWPKAAAASHPHHHSRRSCNTDAGGLLPWHLCRRAAVGVGVGRTPERDAQSSSGRAVASPPPPPTPPRRQRSSHKSAARRREKGKLAASHAAPAPPTTGTTAGSPVSPGCRSKAIHTLVSMTPERPAHTAHPEDRRQQPSAMRKLALDFDVAAIPANHKNDHPQANEQQGPVIGCDDDDDRAARRSVVPATPSPPDARLGRPMSSADRSRATSPVAAEAAKQVRLNVEELRQASETRVLGLRAIETRASQLQHASALIIAEQEARLVERTQKLQPIYAAAAKLRRSNRASNSNPERRREEVLQRGSRRWAKDWGDLAQF